MHRSLSAKLSFWVVLATALLFFGMILHLSVVWRVGIREEVDRDANQVLENAAAQLDDILDDAERTGDVLSWFVIRDLEKPDMMVTHSNNTLRYDKEINSCSISFEPWYFKKKGEYYSIFSWRKSDGPIMWEQEGDDDSRYFEKYWYTLPKELGHACWTEPYTDRMEDDDPDMNTEMLVSYCVPIYDTSHVFVGSISLDLALRRLSDKLYDIKPYEHAFCILIGKDGTYLVHQDPEKLLYHSIFSDADELSQPDLRELGEAMLLQEKGKRILDWEGECYYAYFEPIPTTGWSMAMFCPESDIYGGYIRLQRYMFLSILLGLLLLFFLFVWLIRRQLSPLGKLAEEAGFIASGNLDRTIRLTGRSDEIGVLSKSFQNMQQSLVQHIKELTESTATRERMERELQIARSIQMAMVPHEFDLGKDIDVYASMTPAREVGGDLYDFFVQDGKLYLCIGDVSGKGVPASLFMAVARGMFRVVARQGLSPAEISSRLNDTVSEKNDEMFFVTMFIAVIDLATGAMEYCNCGHNAPVLFTLPDGTPAFLDCKPNTAVGIMPGYTFEDQRVEDMRDKVLFLYTDGLNEAENPDHEQFGNDRMLQELAREPFLDAQSLVERLSAAVDSHVAGAEPSDDLTMLCLRIRR